MNKQMTLNEMLSLAGKVETWRQQAPRKVDIFGLSRDPCLIYRGSINGINITLINRPVLFAPWSRFCCIDAYRENALLGEYPIRKSGDYLNPELAQFFREVDEKFRVGSK